MKPAPDCIKQAQSILKPLCLLIEDKELYHRVLTNLALELNIKYFEGRRDELAKRRDELAKIEEIYGFKRPKNISDN